MLQIVSRRPGGARVRIEDTYPGKTVEQVEGHLAVKLTELGGAKTLPRGHYLACDGRVYFVRNK